MANSTGTGQAPYPYSEPSDTEEWAQDFLYGLGAPEEQGLYGGPTETAYVEQWEANESPSGYGYNPLGETQPEPNATDVPGNPAGVKEYTSWGEGLQAVYDNLDTYPPDANLAAELGSGDASVQELDAAQASGGWNTNPNDVNNPGTGTNEPFTFTGTESGTVQGFGNVAAAGGGGKGVPVWLEDMNNLLNSGQIGQGVGGTFSGLAGSFETGAVTLALKLAIGGVGLLSVLGGLFLLFGPSFLHKAGTATGFGQPTSLAVSRESTARAQQIRADIGAREDQRTAARQKRDTLEQDRKIRLIDARKQANLDLINARKAPKPKGPTVTKPTDKKTTSYTPPGPKPSARRPRRKDEPQFHHGPQGEGSSVGEPPTKISG